jgi:uncharacterized protein (TIGR03083 family)
MDHDNARELADMEYIRLLDILDGLEAADWRRATDCTGWDVRAMIGHVLGMMEFTANPEEAQRQRKAAMERMQRTGGARIDALTALQVEDHAHLSSDELRGGMRDTQRGALAGRFDTTIEQRSTAYDPGPPFDEPWTLGYLLEVILTRDTWMHRVDACRATGRPLVLTADHDGRIVADVVEEWGRRHGQPFTLVLEGPAGGTFCDSDGGAELRLDAVEFCRIVSGRSPGTGLLATAVPF